MLTLNPSDPAAGGGRHPFPMQQTFFPGLEPAPAVRNKRHGAVIEGWKLSAVYEEAVDLTALRMEAPREIVAVWNDHVTRHPAYSADQECFVVFCLNRRNRLIGWQLITLGTVNSCLVHPREVFRPAIVSAACGVVCAHNHPSGDPAPSSADLQITRQLVTAARTVDYLFLDHVVVGQAARDPAGKGYFSFREMGLC